MTITITAAACSYVSDGATLGPYFVKDGSSGIYFETALELDVDLVSATSVITQQTVGMHFTVANAGTDYGSITFLSAPALGTIIKIKRRTSLTQELNLTQAGAFSPSAIMGSLDKLTRQTQDLNYVFEALDSTENAAASAAAAAASLLQVADIEADVINSLALVEDGVVAAQAAATAAAISAENAAAGQIQTNWDATTGLAAIANKPLTFPPSTHTHTSSEISDLLSADQAWTGRHTFNSGTLTDSQPLEIKQTWNNAGVVFNCLLFDVTDTGSASGSMIAIFSVGESARFRVGKDGSSFSAANSVCGAASAFMWTGLSRVLSPSDGVVRLSNNALNNFFLLLFGGTTNAFPALKREAATLRARLGDDSGDTALTALNTAKAWVRLTCSTGAILGSHGVASVTRNANGQYTIAFAAGLFANANYVAVPIVKTSIASVVFGVIEDAALARSATQIRFSIVSTGAGPGRSDADELCLAFFGA